MRPLQVVPVERFEVVVSERKAYFQRLFERWQLLGWTLPNMRRNVGQQLAAAGRHPAERGQSC